MTSPHLYSRNTQRGVAWPSSPDDYLQVVRTIQDIIDGLGGMIFDPFECCKLKPNKLYSTIVDATFKAALQYFGNVLPDGTQINSRDYSEYTSMKDRVIQYAISGTEYRIKMVFWNLAANQRYYLKRLLSIILRFGLHGNISKEKQYLIAGCDVKRCEIPISESRTKNAYFRKYFSKGPLKDERGKDGARRRRKTPCASSQHVGYSHGLAS
jgi:hypothetical protein